MAELIIEGHKVSGAVGNAAAIVCLDKDGNKSTVQAELDKAGEGVDHLESEATDMWLTANQGRVLNEKISNMGEQVDSCFQSVSDGKALVASAITGKGVTTASDATFATMAANIGNIRNGAWNHVWSKIQWYITGTQHTVVTAYSFSDTMPNDGAVYVIHEQKLGSISSSSFTINGVSKSFGTVYDVKKGDAINISVEYKNGSIGQGYGNAGYLVFLYP